MLTTGALTMFKGKKKKTLLLRVVLDATGIRLCCDVEFHGMQLLERRRALTPFYLRVKGG